jgi:hypothetical protein
MNKKLKKYIVSYDLIQGCSDYELKPNGGMIVLINLKENSELFIENDSYKLDSFQSILINAYEKPVYLQSDNEISLVVIRFKGAGASFFYEEYMEEFMYSPNKPIYLEKGILENQIDEYLQNRFKPSKLPFNIMKIIDLLDQQKSDYNIDEVLAIANVPRKILDKLFRLRVGLSIKSYATLKKLKELL